MIKGSEIVCDQCGTVIARITGAIPTGWERLHNLCSRCFAERSKDAVR